MKYIILCLVFLSFFFYLSACTSVILNHGAQGPRTVPLIVAVLKGGVKRSVLLSVTLLSMSHGHTARTFLRDG